MLDNETHCVGNTLLAVSKNNLFQGYQHKEVIRPENNTHYRVKVLKENRIFRFST